jgi:hypothetical protein
VRVLLVLDQEILNSLQVLVNGVPLEIIKVQEPAGTWLLDAIIPVTVLAYHPGMARLCFVVPHTIVPNQIDPGNPDRRSLGLAINWIAVTPVQEMDTLL